jgi:hypothetical protein
MSCSVPVNDLPQGTGHVRERGVGRASADAACPESTAVELVLPSGELAHRQPSPIYSDSACTDPTSTTVSPWVLTDDALTEQGLCEAVGRVAQSAALSWPSADPRVYLCAT